MSQKVWLKDAAQKFYKNNLPFTFIETLFRFLLSVKMVSTEVSKWPSLCFICSNSETCFFGGDNWLLVPNIACNFLGSSVILEWDCTEPWESWDLKLLWRLLKLDLRLRGFSFFSLCFIDPRLFFKYCKSCRVSSLLC